jgi:glyoxylate/hydroxypyruvate reductase A
VVITLPDTTETQGLFNAGALRSMKPDAVLINVGRGSVVVETDLIEALDQGRIRGAVMDVFEQEPLPDGSPLWGKSNAWITPHNSGTSYPPDIVKIFCDNYRRFVQGRELRYLIDFEKGY